MIQQAFCKAYRRDILEGLHRPTDQYMIALYTDRASLSKDTLAYTAIGEVVGDGYASGGQRLSGLTVALKGDTAVLDWDDVEWLLATISARGALVYNATRKNRAIAVFDFGKVVTSTNGPFRVRLPRPTAAEGLIRIA